MKEKYLSKHNIMNIPIGTQYDSRAPWNASDTEELYCCPKCKSEDNLTIDGVSGCRDCGWIGRTRSFYANRFESGEIVHI